MAGDLKAVAYSYWQQGFTVVPIVFVKENGGVKKQPLVEWKKWESQNQTIEEFEALPWDRAEGFAVLCGKPNKEGLSLGVIDFDVKKTTAEAQALGRKALKHLRVTAIEQTPTKGEHHVFYSRRVVQSCSSYHDVAALELLGQGKLCVMAPSKGYTKLNDNLPTVVDDLNAEFRAVLRKAGVLKSEKAERKPKTELNVRPCFKKLLEKPTLSHDERVALVNELQFQGYSLEQVKEIFHENRAWETNYSPEKTDYQIASVYGKYGWFTKKELQARGICFEDCPLHVFEDCRFPSVPEEFDKPLTVDDVIQILGSTVKHDDYNKAITFLAMLLTYTEEDQINLGFLAESSAGKSYIPLELSQYFPKEDVIKLGYASPTAFFHEFGEIVTDPVTKRKIIHVDLKRKILIFLDQPHDQLLQRLRSLLSHDEKDIMFKITDKREKAGLRTKTVIIHGFPTVIFCTAKFGLQEQEKTRLLLLSPEVSQEKLRESIALKIERESDREAFLQKMLEDPQRRLLAARVWSLKKAGIKHVKIPEEFRKLIYDKFLEEHKFLVARHQRDITRLLAIIKGHALLNFIHRRREGDSIIVGLEDVEEGFRLYRAVSEANELGLSPELFNIYQSMKPHFAQKKEVDVDIGKSTKTVTLEGITIREFQGLYASKFHKAIGYEESRRILKTLASVGLVTETPDPTDRRMTRYTLLQPEVSQSEKAPSQIYSSQVGGNPPSGSFEVGEARGKAGGIPLAGREYICEVCGGKATIRVYRNGVEHWFCGKCASQWEGPL